MHTDAPPQPAKGTDDTYGGIHKPHAILNDTRPGGWLKRHVGLVTGLFTIIALVSIWFCHTAENQNLIRSLEAQAASVADAYAALDNGAPSTSVSVALDAGRTVPLFGSIYGKVTVYTRTESPSGETVYRAIEHYYAYANGQWRLTESGGCTGPECRIRAERAFQADAVRAMKE